MSGNAARCLALAAICAVSYAPTLAIPLLEDDYPNISQARIYGSIQGLGQLWSDPTFRLRATSYWVMRAAWSRVGLSAAYYHSLSLLLHVISALLLYALAAQWEPMRRGAFWAAAFFAVHEGHQEAVMWFSAVNELLLFVFGIGAIVCRSRAARSAWWHLPGLILFGLALLSKESAVILVPLLLLVRRRLSWDIAPYIAAAAAAAVSILQSRATSFRFLDGSFSLSAPFWITLPRSAFRLLWIWGVLALVMWVVKRQPRQPVCLALAWIGIALAPYSFLTYSTAIPSRQVYLASAGLAMLVGLAFQHLAETADRRLVLLIAAAILVHNTGTLWTKKRLQFLERAAPAGQLLMRLRSTTGPVHMRCFPRLRIVAEEAVRLTEPHDLPRLVWDRNENGCPDHIPDVPPRIAVRRNRP